MYSKVNLCIQCRACRLKYSFLMCLQVRLMLVLAPVMCILSGIGVSQVLTTYMKNLDVSRPDKKNKKQQDSTYPIKNEVGGFSDRLTVLWHSETSVTSLSIQQEASSLVVLILLFRQNCPR